MAVFCSTIAGVWARSVLLSNKPQVDIGCLCSFSLPLLLPITRYCLPRLSSSKTNCSRVVCCLATWWKVCRMLDSPLVGSFNWNCSSSMAKNCQVAFVGSILTIRVVAVPSGLLVQNLVCNVQPVYIMILWTHVTVYKIVLHRQLACYEIHSDQVQVWVTLYSS